MTETDVFGMALFVAILGAITAIQWSVGYLAIAIGALVASVIAFREGML